MLTRDYADVVDRPHAPGPGRRRKPEASERMLLQPLPLLLDRHADNEPEYTELPAPEPPEPSDWVLAPEEAPTELIARVPVDDDAPLYGGRVVALVNRPVTALADAPTESIPIVHGPRVTWRDRLVAAGLPKALRRSSTALTAAAARVHLDA